MRLLLFDIDGTLLSAKGAGRRALEHALAAHYELFDGLKDVPLDGKTDPLIVREALEANGHSFSGLDPAFVNTYLSQLETELAQCHDFAVMAGVVELMSYLGASAGLLVGLATGNIQEGAWMKVRRAELGRHFRFGGYGCDGENRTEVIRAAIRRGAELAGQPVRDVVVIGDTPRDIEHGKEAGARVLAVSTGSYDAASLERCGPDMTVNSLQPREELLRFLELTGSRRPSE